MNFTTNIVLLLLALRMLSLWHLSNYPNQLDFRYKSYGSRDKETIVVIPGLDGAMAFFNDIIPELTEQYHVIAFHIPLRVKSMKDSDYTFSYFANEIKLIIDELGIDKASVVGESFGGVIAQHFALEHPERLAKLVLFSSLAKTDLPAEVQWKLDYIMPVVEMLGGQFPGLAQILFAHVHVYDVVEPNESRYVRDLFIKEASVAHFFSVVARVRIVSKLDIVERVKAIQTPTLVVYGSDDHFTKEASKTLHELLPNSFISSLPGGHLAHVTNPKMFANMIKNFVM